MAGNNLESEKSDEAGEIFGEEKRPMITSNEDILDSKLGEVANEAISDMVSDEVGDLPGAKPDKLPSDYVSAPMEVNSETEDGSHIKLANQVCRKALYEVINRAREAGTWISEYTWDEMTVTADEANEFSSLTFDSEDASEMKTLHSVTEAYVPLPPCHLLFIMLNLEMWRQTFGNIVYKKHQYTLDGGLEQLSQQYPDVRDLKMVTASFHLPIPFVPPQEFQFLRYLMVATEDSEVWAILDVSVDFFPIETANVAPAQASVRRPSGVLIRQNGSSGSQLIWIENVKVHRRPFEEFYPHVLFDSTFSSARWVDALQEKLKHHNKLPTSLVHNPTPQDLDRKHLACLAYLMKVSFLHTLFTAPLKAQWSRVDADVDDAGRIGIYYRDVPNTHHPAGFSNSIAMTRFVVDATPLSVFLYLIEKNLSINWNTLEVDTRNVPITVSTLASDDAYAITLRKEVTNCRHVMEEVLLDDYCSYVISSPLYGNSPNAATRGGYSGLNLHSSGFTIVPVGSGGYNADASLVTIVAQQRFPMSHAATAGFIFEISRMIKHEFKSEC